MKTIIAGSRTIKDYGVVYQAITEFQTTVGVITEVVCGCAKGVDELGQLWAERHGAISKRFPANWLKYGRAAGPIRNSQMAEYADALLAIWDGESKGTANMIQQAKERGLKIHIHRLQTTSSRV